MPEGTLEAKRAIITGASAGIGGAIAVQFASAGANVWAAGGSDADGLNQTIAECAQHGVQAGGRGYDLSNSHAAAQLVQEGAEFLGGLDILVNCAGTRVLKPIIEVEDDEVDLVFEVNAKSTYIASREAARLMVPQKSGQILMVGSSAGVGGRVNFSLYSVSKAVLHSLTKCLALELGPLGIRVNCLAPGLVTSKRVKSHLDADPEYAQMRLENIPIRQYGTVEDMAATALFMVSPENRFMNGAIVMSDGGVTAR